MLYIVNETIFLIKSELDYGHTFHIQDLGHLSSAVYDILWGEGTMYPPFQSPISAVSTETSSPLRHTRCYAPTSIGKSTYKMHLLRIS
jgi:hypothetical protein